MKKSILLYFMMFTITLSTYATTSNGDESEDKTVSETLENKDVLQSNNGGGGKQGFDRSKLSFGGNFGLQFSNGHALISVIPQVGYSVSKFATIGAGIGYTYHRSTFFDRGDYDFRSNYFGFNLFGHFFPQENIIINVQPEINRMWRSVRLNGKTIDQDTQVVPILVLGAGLRFNGVMALIQYDVVQNRYSPYGNTIFYTIGYSFNF